jgi:HAMP domain-containing protein/predicted Ser/Thr protein kinase
MLDRGTISDVELPKKEYAVERARFPLVVKLFGLTAILIVIVVAIAVGITIERANEVANETVSASINGAAKLFRELEEQRLARLRLPTEILGGDTNFVALIQVALQGEPAPAPENAGAAPAPSLTAPETVPPPAPAIDLDSIVDQIVQRRESFGTDLVMLIDGEGRVIARTDMPKTATSPMTDLYTRTNLVQTIVDDASVASTQGVMALDGKLYHAVVAPVGGGARGVRIAYLVNAVAIDERFANRIAESTRAGVIFAPKGDSTTVRSSNAPSVMPKQVAIGTTQTETVDRSQYILTSQPLLAGREPVGTAIFLRSKDRELAPFREIERSLMIGGGVALLLAFLLSWLIAKRVTRPIEQLAGIAQAVTAGDYSVGPDVTRNDEVGILGRSFGKMINSLRDKVELEELYAAMAEKSDEIQAGVRPTEAAALDEGTVLVTDLRGLPATVGDGDAASVIATVERAMRVQEAEVLRQDGEVREINGHQLISVFRGERGIIHAIRAARTINEELALQLGPNTMTLGVGIATGEFVSGSVTLNNDSGLALVGNAPLLALLFAWHAPNGFAYVSYETAQAAGGEVLTTATREEVRLKWLPNPLPVAALPLVSVTTGMMRSIGAVGTDTSMAATMRMSDTVPGATAPGAAQADLPIGVLFANRYQIDSILGRGGMGVVYKATDTQLDETVAIKTLPGDVMTRSPEDLERFKREIRLARKITHRNVLRTFDYGEADGVYFISMEFVRGYTLSELLDEAENRQMATRAAVGLTRQICRGLQAAHEQGIIHRDIKPQNVLVDAKGEAKLMDFGIARMAEAREGVTQQGLIVGTPHYMSPEQVQGKQLDARSDVYSLGIMIYEMLVGRRPFESSSLTGVLTAHITEAPKPPVTFRPDLSPTINAIVMRCLAKDPATRYANAGELLADMEEYRSAA